VGKERADFDSWLIILICIIFMNKNGYKQWGESLIHLQDLELLDLLHVIDVSDFVHLFLELLDGVVKLVQFEVALEFGLLLIERLCPLRRLLHEQLVAFADGDEFLLVVLDGKLLDTLGLVVDGRRVYLGEDANCFSNLVAFVKRRPALLRDLLDLLKFQNGSFLIPFPLIKCCVSKWVLYWRCGRTNYSICS
jgi:hypothetical protein